MWNSLDPQEEAEALTLAEKKVLLTKTTKKNQQAMKD